MDHTDHDGEWYEKVVEFNMMDCTDHDGNWHLSPNMSSENKMPSLQSLRSCVRRRSDANRSSPFSSLMNWSLTRAAQAFAQRLLRSHGAQEGDQGELPAVLHLQDDARRGGEAHTSQDGNSQVRGSLVPRGDSHVSFDLHDHEPDGVGLSPEEGQRDRRRALHAGEGEAADEAEGQEQGGQEGMDSSGNRSTHVQIPSPGLLERQPGDMYTPRRVHEVPSQSTSTLVVLPSMRKSMGTPGSRSRRVLFDDNCSGAFQCQEASDQCGILPGVSTSSSFPTKAGQHSTPSGPPRQDHDDPWSDWIRADPKGQDDSEVCLSPTRALPVQGSKDGGSTRNATTKEVPRPSSSIRPDRARAPGICRQRRGEALAEGGHGQQVPTEGRQRLVGKSQLGGKHGSMLGKFLSSRFSKFMVFLCMNCCLSPATTMAFGSPDLVAWHNVTENSFNDDSHLTGQTAAGMTCYVYGQSFTRHFANSAAESFGKTQVLTKQDKKMVKDALKVMEIYSPERVTKKAAKYGFTSGGALDLTNGWNFSKKSHQEAALRLIREKQPVLVILSPPCTAFSRLRSLSNFKRNPDIVRQEEAEAIEHVRFSVLIARIQHRAGRGFLFEHPKGATSWSLPSLSQLRDEPGVHTINLDMCRFGLRTSQGLPALKPTMLLTNLEALVNVLGRRCEGFHLKHGPLLAGEAKLAAKYTPMFVDAILRGLRQHVQAWVKFNQTEEDFWEDLEDSVVRHHRVPRRALFTPTGVSGCPSPTSKLTSQRTTKMTFLQGSTQVFSDNWRSAEAPKYAFTKLWKGTTTFQKHEPIVLPPNWRAAANYVVQAAAHPIYEYLTSETALQVDWNAAFPTHKMLGGGPVSSSAASAAAVDEPTTSSMSSRRGLQDQQLAEVAQHPELPQQAEGDEMVVEGEIEDPDTEEETAEGRAKHALRDLKVKPLPTDAILHPEMRRELFRVHRNLGHPSRQVMTRALRHAGAKKEVIEFVKHHFRCDLCDRKQLPSSHRPSKLQTAMEFNSVVGIDIFQVKVPDLGDLLLLNCLCWGSNLQVVELLESKHSETVYEAFAKVWLMHYGPPGLLVSDQGREFLGYFAEKINQLGVPQHFIDARSPWQNGRTEKAGGIFKTRLETVLHEISATTIEEVRAAIYETAMAHNRYYNRAGFTPFQRAFGTLPRLPASLLSDHQIDKEMILESAGDSMQRAWQIREKLLEKLG